MTELMKKIIHRLVILAILGFAFYWYSWRPTQIKKECFNQADKQKKAVINSEDVLLSGGFPLTQRADYDKVFNDIYQECLLKNGLTK
jgi:hypothetical protein